ncbi:SDR family oxidoreductase [Spirosoma aureum]|uniref:SDR family oxidoreductase n=1 Tax=Spirosoma aureum TaxID=2692134 RepID=A0A6G9ANG3_9BACT|nr:SDR family oxidoreductase [Spirosoma aureum]QIP13876.1 SDR family oxidoreductase [Spirosoma aureum]
MSALQNKVALITGASSGFGVGIARQLRQAGATVYITARQEDKLRAVATEIGAIAVVADVTKASDWDTVFDLIRLQHNRLDILVNNAGAGGDIVDIADQSDAAIEQTIALNLTGAILGSKRAAQLMRTQRDGIIINISSICAVQAWSGWGVYGAAKAGLDQLTRHLYVELRPFGVRVTSLVPSWGATGFKEASNLDEFDAETAAKAIHPIDIGNVVTDICLLPAHLVIPEMRLLPLVQEIQAY